MLKEIVLKSYGRFKNRSFPLSPVTLFLGNNESGKTTLFDAIFDTVCSPKGNTATGKQLALRYGDDRRAELVFDGDPVRIEQDEFLNLYAIGAGDIKLDLCSGGSWIERIKSSIFSGGIDPGKISAEFDLLASEKGGMKHMKNLREREKAQREASNALEVVTKKSRILEGEKSNTARRLELDALSSGIGAIESTLSEKMRLLAQQEKIREREGLVRTMELVGKYNALAVDLASLDAFRDDKSALLKSLQGSSAELKSNEALCEKDAENSSETLESAVRRLEEQRKRAEMLKSSASIAFDLARLIESDAPRPVIREVAEWSGIMLALAILPFAIGASFFALLYPSVPAVTSLIGGLVAGLLLVFFARRHRAREERPDPAPFIARLRDLWRNRTGGGELASSTLEGIHRELVTVQSESDSAVGEISRLAGEESSLRSRHNEMMRKAREAGEGLGAAVRSLEEALRSIGVKDIDEYARKRAEYLQKSDNRNRYAADLEADMKQLGVAGIDRLRAECELRAARLRDEITAEKLSEAGKNNLVKEIESLKRELRETESRQNALRSDLDKREGEVKGSMGNLPELIHEKDITIRRLQEEIDELVVSRRAAAIARDIFNEISRDSDMVFAGLGGDIAKFLGGILPGAREVAMSDFDTSGFLISDAGGKRRSLEHLSTGTRDSFYLAARLALALRSREEGLPGIIVLDEPFHSLDEERIVRALELLKRFHEEQGWQIILFSKDRGAGERIRDLFNGVRIHELDRTG